MKHSAYNKPALRIAIYYFIFGFLWILLSDIVAHKISVSNRMEQNLQTYKGWFFILSTTILIFLMVKQQMALVIKLKNKLLKSEQRYKKIVTVTHELIWDTDKEGRITFINDACKSIYGVSPDEMIGKKFSDFIGQDQYDKNVETLFGKLKLGQTSFAIEYEITHTNGRQVYLRDTVIAILDEDGQIDRLEGVSTDITDYKIYERQLVKNKQSLELAMYGGEIGLWEYWHGSSKLIVNENWKEILGIETNTGEISAEMISSLVHPDDVSHLEKAFRNPVKGNDKYIKSEFRMRHTDGSYRWITSKGKVVEWEEGKSKRMMGAIIDTTEKKHLELELKNLVDLYSSFIRFSSEGIYLFEMNEPMPVNLPIEKQIKQLYHDGYIRTCNDAFAKMYGYQNGEEMVGTDQQTLHGSDNDPKNIELLRRFIKSGYRIMDDVTKEIDKDGNSLYISNNVVGIVENGFLLRTWGSQRNITTQIHAQQKIEESEISYRLLFETNPVPLAIFNAANFASRDINQAFENLLGYTKSDLTKLTLRDLRPDVADLTNEKLQELIIKELSQNIEMVLVSKSGKSIPCEVKIDQIDYYGELSILGAINDITEVKNTEKMVIQSLIEGTDNERSRVAKEPHDGLGQSLTAASLNLNSLIPDIGKLGEMKKEKLENGIKFLRTAIEESRNIAHNLMPKAIEDFGVVLSLKSLFNQIEKATELSINFYENIGEKLRLDMQVELNIYRITQEAINNVIKHANASEIFVQLMVHPNEIIYTFEDNGVGFDKIITNSGKKGIGIKSMYNRAKAMSGECDVESSIGEGTTITIVIPIEQ